MELRKLRGIVVRNRRERHTSIKFRTKNRAEQSAWGSLRCDNDAHSRTRDELKSNKAQNSLRVRPTNPLQLKGDFAYHVPAMAKKLRTAHLGMVSDSSWLRTWMEGHGKWKVGCTASNYSRHRRSIRVPPGFHSVGTSFQPPCATSCKKRKLVQMNTVRVRIPAVVRDCTLAMLRVVGQSSRERWRDQAVSLGTLRFLRA